MSVVGDQRLSFDLQRWGDKFLSGVERLQEIAGALKHGCHGDHELHRPVLPI